MKKISFLLICSLLAVFHSVLAQNIVFPANKLGVFYWELRAPKYTLDNQTDDGSDSKAMAGPVLYYERILSDVFTIGLKYGSGLRREMNIKLGNDEVNIKETASYQALEFKSYGTKHRKSGFKPYLAVSYGMLSTTSSITTKPSAGAATEDETKAVIPIKAWCLGVDYLLWKLAFRLEIGQSNGDRIDRESSDTYQATYDFNSFTSGIGLAYFF